MADEKPIGSMREPIAVPRKRAAKAVLTVRTKDGREWVIAGAFGAAHPVGHLSPAVELEDLQELDPIVLGMSVVLGDIPDTQPILDVTEPGQPVLLAADGSSRELGTIGECQHAPDGGNHPVVGQ